MLWDRDRPTHPMASVTVMEVELWTGSGRRGHGFTAKAMDAVARTASIGGREDWILCRALLE